CLSRVLIVLFSVPGASPRATRCPYTTLFRSQHQGEADERNRDDERAEAVLDDGEPEAEDEAKQREREVDRSGRQRAPFPDPGQRSEEHTSELQSRFDLVCRLLLEKKNRKK